VWTCSTFLEGEYFLNIFCKVLFGKYEMKRLLERRKHMWEDNINMYFKETDFAPDSEYGPGCAIAQEIICCFPTSATRAR
jgi:hypothetical protein